MIYYEDAVDAMKDSPPNYCIGSHDKGWVLYDPTMGCPDDVTPEILMLKNGIHPIPLTEWSVRMLKQIYKGV